ncbi:MAG: putative sugar nucleotidyl transferase [Patescibacteria group bacterium]
MRIVVSNDNPAALLPFTHVNPLWDVNVGGITLRKWMQAVMPEGELIEHGGPEHVMTRMMPCVVVNGRLLPSSTLADILHRFVREGRVRRCMAGDEIGCGYLTGKDAPVPEIMPEDITIMRGPWDIISTLPQTLHTVASLFIPHYAEVRPNVFVGKNVTVPPTVVTRTDDGPIVIGSGSVFESFVALEGPVVIGEDCIIRDFACIKKSAIGNVCRIGGELERSVIGDYTNKQHYGYVGHSVVGSWVNLGAGTTTSDLKHTYGSVRIDRGAGKEETGLQFCGSFIGEGSRTTVNTTLMTGSVLGVSTFAFGTVHGFVPSFTAATSQGFTEVPLEIALRGLERAFARRKVTMTPPIRDAYTVAFERTAVVRDAYKVKRGVPLTF